MTATEAHYHGCSCHINPPCGACEGCAHWDGKRDENCIDDCQECECMEGQRPGDEPMPKPTAGDYARWAKEREWEEWQRTNAYGCLPYSKMEWGYASVRYTLRKMTRENTDRVVKELIASHTYFGYRWDPGNVLVIYVD